MRGSCVLVMAVVVSIVGPAGAANINHLGAGPSKAALIATDAPLVLERGTMGARISTSFGVNPLVCASDRYGVVGPIVGTDSVTTATLALGFVDGLELSASVPLEIMNPAMTADGTVTCPSAVAVPTWTMAPNDPIVRARWRVVDWRPRGFGLAFEAAAKLPIASLLTTSLAAIGAPELFPLSRASLFGDPLGAAVFKANPGYHFGPARIVGEAGFVLRPTADFFGERLGSELVAGAGFEVHALLSGLVLVADLFGRASGDATRLSSALSSSTTQAGLELVVGPRLHIGNFLITGGVGGGILSGYGTPQGRVVVGIGYAPGLFGFSTDPLFELPGFGWWKRLFTQPLDAVEVRPTPPVPPRPALRGWQPKDPPRKSVDVPCPTDAADALLFLRSDCFEAERTRRDDVAFLDSIDAAGCPMCERTTHHTHEIVQVLHVWFSFDDSTINEVERARVAREVLHPAPGVRTQVRLVGHTDGAGAGAYNQALSERRVAAVRALLVALGVPEPVIIGTGAGEGDPLIVDPVQMNDEEPANRRVRIEITSIVVSGFDDVGVPPEGR